jgi:glycosyltransferase involved in cell wall biosynthesis
MPLLSIVIPSYNEEESLEYVAPAIHEVLDSEGIKFEIVFVDDGSSDLTYAKIRALSSSAENIRGLRLSRNFGKEAAIWAGLQHAKGDCCVVMDCDLQHPPAVLAKMYRLWESGYEVVEGVKSHRGAESKVYSFFSDIFYRVITVLSGFDMRTSSDFKLLDRRVINELMQFKERNTFFRGLSFWVGYRSTKLEYQVAPRHHGNSKWGIIKLVKYAINNVLGFSTAPMQLVTLVGGGLIAVSMVLGVQTLVRFLWGYALEGFTTVIMLLLLIGGSLMISIGIIGLYIAKIYDEVKGRPRFIVSESTE